MPWSRKGNELSSAEDKTSSTVLPSQGSSNSAPEEFPVAVRQEHAPEHASEHGSSASPAGEPPQVELKADASPAQSAEEPSDDVAVPLKTKRLPKANAAAREVRVNVTGARVGGVSGERELFSESTATVLVFEKGGVIRLTAAVAPGQLLFFTNEESKREVVAQVMRKRVYRPTECYVEFEFTEPAPGFWGMQFSAATALLPQDAKVIAAAEMISSAETTDDELAEAAPLHSSEEVESLKREVEALRSQLSQLQTQAEPAQVKPSGAIFKSPAVPPLSVSPVDARPLQAPPAEAPSYQTEKVAWAELTADVSPMEGEPKPTRVTAADHDLQPKPALVFRKSMLPPKRSFRARGQFTPGFRSGMLRVAVLSGVLAALIGFVWYKHWLPWMHESTKFSVSSFAGGVITKVATPGTSTAAKASTGINEPLSAKGATPGTGSSAVAAASEMETGSSAYEVVEKPATREKSKLAPTITRARSSAIVPVPAKMVNSVPTSTGNPNIVPPKLVKSERAVASLEDLRDFETGSVVIDAIVDTDGNVSSPTVLSGPPSLRRPALEAVKYYRYQPAMQNGRPVVAHVTVKIQFHFE